MVYYKGKKPLRYKKKATPKRKVVKKAIKKATNKIFAQKVLKVIKRQEETKYAAPITANTPLYGYSPLKGNFTPADSSTVIDLTAVFQNVSQGTGQGQRIGNVIKPVKFVFRGYITAQNNSAQSTGADNPTICKMIIMRMKDTKNAINPDMSSFFQNGNSTSIPTNTLRDIRNMINKDEIVVYATRTFKLGSQEYGTGYNQNNNDFKLTQTFNVDLTRYVRTAIYNDTFNEPTNCQFFAVFLFGMYNGLPLPALVSGGLTDYPANVSIDYDILLSYKDA